MVVVPGSMAGDAMAADPTLLSDAEPDAVPVPTSAPASAPAPAPAPPSSTSADAERPTPPTYQQIEAFGYQRFTNREQSRLDFGARLLDLAEDDGIPLLERAKFLAIF